MSKIDSWQDLYDALNWKADMRVINDFGEDVWLKPYYRNGKRVGITDCCFADNPCPRHRKIQQQQTSQAWEDVKDKKKS